QAIRKRPLSDCWRPDVTVRVRLTRWVKLTDSVSVRRKTMTRNALGKLSSELWDELTMSVDRLEAAYADASEKEVDLSGFLPQPDDPMYPVILLELVRSDIQIRCKLGRFQKLERYVEKYPELGALCSTFADLIYEEHRARHPYLDKPPL